MAKKRTTRKSKKKKKAQNQNVGAKIFAVIFIIAMIVGFVYPLLQKSPQKTSTQTTSSESNMPIPPEFKKEGELHFIKKTSSDSLKIDIEIAQTEKETSQGLMYRTSLGSKQGMLFIFDKPDMRSFWMKNTYIPLDIMFVDSSLQIITLHTNTQALSTKSVSSSGRAQYVVEVKAGFCARHGIKEGDHISFKLLKKS